MAQEYSRVHDFYLQLNELQPTDPFQHFDDGGNCSGYQMTAGGGSGANAAGQLPPHHHNMPQQQDPRAGKMAEGYETAASEVSYPDTYASTSVIVCKANRKRKPCSYGPSSTYDDDGIEEKSCCIKKQNHSEIEKRRRDKMNTYITELSSMVPMCGAMARKLDKLTVLRMAVQHLRTVRGSLSACPLTARPVPGFLSDTELNTLILQTSRNCFLLVVGCDRGRLVYVSASVKHVLHYDHAEILGQSLFDILHPKDVAKVKEQLSSPDLSPRERLIDAKTMLPVKPDMVSGASRLCPGARRSFFCRIKCKSMADLKPPPVKNETDGKLRKKQITEKKYIVVQFTGYLKSWESAELSNGPSCSSEAVEDETTSMTCLVALGRVIPDHGPPSTTIPSRRVQYSSRHAPDGRFLFVDQRVTLALGFLPQELLGTSMYEYVSGKELGAVAQAHKMALLHQDALHTTPYNFRRKDGTMAIIQTHFKPFRNPWTKEVECLVANNTIVSEMHITSHQEAAQRSLDMLKQKSNMEMQRLIDSQVESHKIGSAIAEQALSRNSADYSPKLHGGLSHDMVFGQESTSLTDNLLGVDTGDYEQVRNNVPLSAARCASSPTPADAALPHLPGTPPLMSPLPALGIDGNGEAAMAVIMSLLEADAGLGGPVNFSGLPWPLP